MAAFFYMKQFTAAVLVFCIGLAWAEEPVKPTVQWLAHKSPDRVLFVGNSYFYYNDSLHNHVRRLLAELQSDLVTEYKSATIGGARLAHHNVPHLLKRGQLGVKEPFQLVILQGGSSETLSADSRQQFHLDVDRINREVREAGSELALYMTHAYVAPHVRANEELFPLIQKNYVTAGNRNDALVIPVGLAFERAREERPDIRLHESFDGSHPNVQGSYLAACVVVASVYGINPTGARYSAYGEVSASDKEFLQLIAWQTVNEFFDR